MAYLPSSGISVDAVNQYRVTTGMFRKKSPTSDMVASSLYSLQSPLRTSQVSERVKLLKVLSSNTEERNADKSTIDRSESHERQAEKEEQRLRHVSVSVRL